MSDVTRDTPSTRSARLGRAAMGERLGGYIYGTIVVLSVVVAGARAYPHDTAHIAALAIATTVAFWLAHVYAHSVAHSIARGEHLSPGELRHIARREASIMEAAAPPVAALLLGAFGLISTQAAVWLAFGLGLIVLAAEGVAVARIERLGLLGSVAVVAGNVSLGVVLVGLKLFVSH